MTIRWELPNKMGSFRSWLFRRWGGNRPGLRVLGLSVWKGERTWTHLWALRWDAHAAQYFPQDCELVGTPYQTVIAQGEDERKSALW
jgi:hypothetical protein